MNTLHPKRWTPSFFEGFLWADISIAPLEDCSSILGGRLFQCRSPSWLLKWISNWEMTCQSLHFVGTLSFQEWFAWPHRKCCIICNLLLNTLHSMIYTCVLSNSGKLVNIWSMLIKNPYSINGEFVFENSKVTTSVQLLCQRTSSSILHPPHCCIWVLRADLYELHQPRPPASVFAEGSAGERHSRRSEAGRRKRWGIYTSSSPSAHNPSKPFWATDWQWPHAST